MVLVWLFTPPHRPSRPCVIVNSCLKEWCLSTTVDVPSETREARPPKVVRTLFISGTMYTNEETTSWIATLSLLRTRCFHHTLLPLFPGCNWMWRIDVLPLSYRPPGSPAPFVADAGSLQDLPSLVVTHRSWGSFGQGLV